MVTGAKADYNFNGNGANPTGDALVIDNCSYPGGAPTASVTVEPSLAATPQRLAAMQLRVILLSVIS